MQHNVSPYSSLPASGNVRTGAAEPGLGDAGRRPGEMLGELCRTLQDE